MSKSPRRQTYLVRCCQLNQWQPLELLALGLGATLSTEDVRVVLLRSHHGEGACRLWVGDIQARVDNSRFRWEPHCPFQAEFFDPPFVSFSFSAFVITYVLPSRLLSFRDLDANAKLLLIFCPHS